ATRQLDFPVVHCCHHLAIGKVHPAEFEPGHVVHSEDSVHRETIEEAIADHCRTTLHRLFTRLEDETYRSVEVPGISQVLARTEQHGCVTVVAAQVRDPVHSAAVRKIVHLLNRERVEVGPQAYGLRPVTRGQGRHDAVLADSGLHLIAPFLHQPGDVAGGFRLLHRELGVSVHVLEPLLHLALVSRERLENLAHLGIRSFWVSCPCQEAYSATRCLGMVSMMDTMAPTTISRLIARAKNAASRTARFS